MESDNCDRRCVQFGYVEDGEFHFDRIQRDCHNPLAGKQWFLESKVKKGCEETQVNS